MRDKEGGTRLGEVKGTRVAFFLSQGDAPLELDALIHDVVPPWKSSSVSADAIRRDAASLRKLEEPVRRLLGMIGPVKDEEGVEESIKYLTTDLETVIDSVRAAGKSFAAIGNEVGEPMRRVLEQMEDAVKESAPVGRSAALEAPLLNELQGAAAKLPKLLFDAEKLLS